MRASYRADIDGLRAISIIAVLFYHFFPAILPGGFTGVDVFFVISGYLVTRTISVEMSQNEFSFKRFYARRVRRLMPALLVILIVSLIFSAIFNLAEDFVEIAEQVIAGAGMFENILMLREEGYFSERISFKPLLHLWSLSVEEQFYLIWPIVIYFGGKFFKARNAIIILALTICSLVLNASLIQIKHKYAFYLLPPRIWEIAAGGVLYFLEDKIPSSWKRAAFPVGVFFLLGSFIFLSGKLAYPGYWALLPVLGAIAVMIGREKKLNHPILIWLGILSYPIYLWHWLILSFFNYLFPDPITHLDRLFLLITSVLLGHLTYLWMERPFQKMPEMRAARILIPGTILVLIASFLVIYFKGFPNRYPELEKNSIVLEDYVQSDRERPHDLCGPYPIISFCQIADSTKSPTVAIIGDSHSEHWYPGLKDYYQNLNENLLLMGIDHTPPVINPNHENTNEIVFKILQENPTIHTVIMSAYWPMYANEKPTLVGGITRFYPIMNPELLHIPISYRFGIHFAKTITKLKDMDKKIIVLNSVPGHPTDPLKVLPRPFMEETYFVCLFEDNLCGVPLKTVEQDQQIFRATMAHIIQINPDVEFLDVSRLLCDSESCNYQYKGKIVYWDEYHLSLRGSKILAPLLFKSN